MRALQITLFVLGLSILTAQSFRDVYMKWLEPRTSVLDQFKEKAESDVARAHNLQELVALYKDAHSKVKQYEQSHPEDTRPDYERSQTEPYKTEATIRGAIEEWESTAKERRSLLFFWSFGVVVVLAGMWLYRGGKAWLGMTYVITGFAEMIWWCSPSFRSFGSDELERLLTAKLILSLISWLLLIVVWGLGNCGRRVNEGSW